MPRLVPYLPFHAAHILLMKAPSQEGQCSCLWRHQWDDLLLGPRQKEQSVPLPFPFLPAPLAINHSMYHRTFATNRGMIRKMLFSPSRGHLLLTLFNEGEFAVWDVDHGVRLSVSSYLLGRSLKALDLDWMSPFSPIVGKGLLSISVVA